MRYRRDHWGRNLPLGVGHAVGRGERLSHGTSPGRTKRAKSWRTLFETREEPGQGVADPTGLRYRPLRGRVAQRIEHLASNQRLASSSPSALTNKLKGLCWKLASAVRLASLSRNTPRNGARNPGQATPEVTASKLAELAAYEAQTLRAIAILQAGETRDLQAGPGCAARGHGRVVAGGVGAGQG